MKNSDADITVYLGTISMCSLNAHGYVSLKDILFQCAASYILCYWRLLFCCLPAPVFHVVAGV